MKTRLISHLLTLPAVFAAWLLTFAAYLPAFAQGTAFTYQGRLNNNGAIANGSYDLQFTLFDAATGGSQIGGALTTNAVAVTNGLFTLALDFGAGAFSTGADRWLFLSVKSNGVVSFTPLTPLQHITAAPYAITAGNLSGTVASTGLSGTYANAVTLNNGANNFGGNGAGLTNLNADQMGGLGAANFWIVGGNASTGGASLGNGDNQPLNLISWGSRVLQLETRSVSLGLFDSWSAVNTLGGASGNVISDGVLGGTVAGGGAETNHLFSSEPAPNTVLDNFGTVGGGINNTAGYASTDFDDARSATVGGGEGNTASNAWATVGGGQRNTGGGLRATVGGGSLNSAIGGSATVGGGDGNAASQTWATVAGGHANTSSGPRATVGGGDGNISSSDTTTVAGGRFNNSSGISATVGGGNQNTASGFTATVPGGDRNLAAGDYSFAAGYQAKANHPGSFVWSDLSGADFISTANNQFLIRAAGGVGINKNNPAAMLDVNGTIAASAFFGNGAGLTLSPNVALLDANQTFTGNNTIGPSANISFGNTTRQMLNLFGNFYGIGVQSYTMYFRTDGNAGGFSWFKGGVHSDNQNNAGGGVELMRLDSLGNLSVRGIFAANVLLTSDRNAKERFQAVDSRAVLDKVAALPVSEWQFKNDQSTRHIGPMAQDFYAAFGVGSDDKHIAIVDEGGVALAAIQGLNEKLEASSQRSAARSRTLEERLQQKEREITELKKAVADLKDVVERSALNPKHR